MFLVILAVALADTADTADTAEPRDTAPYVDTGAVREEVFVQDVGCGGAAAGLLLAVGLLGAGRRR
ncbi:MAG: hypothetical protein ACK4YP_11990 [Myxococcota bacterium]